MSKEKGALKGVKGYLNHTFIDGLSGMTLGLFCTLIIGTILAQVGTLFGGAAGGYIASAAGIAKSLMGAGIGVGVAYKFKRSPLVTASCAVAGMVGAFAARIIAGTVIVDGAVSLIGPGEPLGAFVAAFVAAEVGNLVAGKTKIDILLTPLVTIGSGAAVGLLVGPTISKLMASLGNLINLGAGQQPLLMGVIVAVIMGIILTGPISSAAISVILGLSGIAAGAAVAGCCAQMIGFAVISFRDNKFGGLVAQGLGTSMLQMPNIIKKPLIWIPPIVASAITGPISAGILGMTCNATGAGMGTSGIIGPLMSYQEMRAAGMGAGVVIAQIVAVHVVLPAVLSYVVYALMRRKGIIKDGDMKLEV
ncbi:MAG: PTS sugar transporter subunit IIC [Oscillospiraceae bacterium]|nr:PTS sugar transporter subunit IIC [Oscillospiraceae bacterium]